MSTQQEKPLVYKREHLALKFIQIRIDRIRIRQNDAGPTRSRSKTLLSTFQYSNCRKPRLSGSGFKFSHAADPGSFYSSSEHYQQPVPTVSYDIQWW
jgi:hypothetical protein